MSISRMRLIVLGVPSKVPLYIWMKNKCVHMAMALVPDGNI